MFVMNTTMEVALVEVTKIPVQKGKPRMLAAVEVRAIFCAKPPNVERGETKGVWIPRRSAELGISPSLGKRIFYRLVKRIDADTL
ncbi:MAG TPA: hypothetical protein VNM37_24475, partial [Candidatus Dormibacteraeota bacterium]|nr:hypothetical protein [Candidatus Dormibacteraeota bacterium]